MTMQSQIIVALTASLTFLEKLMKDDPRCCGTGTCIINDEGYCWCGQRWDGEKMCFESADSAQSSDTSESNNQKKAIGNENAQSGG